jgi:hypothetical protein
MHTDGKVSAVSELQRKPYTSPKLERFGDLAALTHAYKGPKPGRGHAYGHGRGNAWGKFKS